MVQRYSVKDSNPTTLEHLGEVYLYGDGETDSNIYIRNNISGTTSIYWDFGLGLRPLLSAMHKVYTYVSYRSLH